MPIKYLDDSEVKVDTNTDKPTGNIKYLADSQQPKDVYTQFDASFKNMMDNIKTMPYVSNAYSAAVQSLPVLDPMTKLALANGDTTLLKEVYTTPAMHGLNQMLFNYPRAALREYGYNYPEGETIPGVLAARAGGVAGALTPFSMATKAAGKIVPYSLLAGRSSLKTAGRGAVAGGIQGAAYAPENPEDPNARLKQAATGAMIGALISPVASKITNFIAKNKQRKGMSITERVGRRRADIDLDNTRKELNEDALINESDQLLTENLKELQDHVAIQAVQGQVPKYEKAFTDFSKNVSRVYEEGVDSLSKRIGIIDKAGAEKHFQDFLDTVMSDPDFANTNAVKKIEKFVNIFKTDKKLSFNDINASRKAVLSSKFKGNVDDAIYTQFRKSFLEYADSIDPTGSFGKLNKAVAPQLNFKNQFIRTSSAYNKYKTSGIENLLVKYAERDTNPKNYTVGDRRLMNDALTYLKRFGIESSDIDAIYGKKNIEQMRLEKVRGMREEISTKRRLEKAITSNLRTKQDLKLGRKWLSESKSIGKAAFDTAIRLSITAYILDAVRGVKKAILSTATQGSTSGSEQ